MPGYPLRTLLLLLFLATSGALLPGAEPSQKRPSSIEISQVDVFSLQGWDSSHVSFAGFRLGMERKEAFRNAQDWDLTMDDDSGQGCLKAATCHLLKSGKYIGLIVTFGISDSIQSIRVEVPSSNVSRKEKENWLVAKMCGQTRELFENYSDSLRARLLGIANANWFDATTGVTPFDSPANQEYQYYSKGLILRVRSEVTKPSHMPHRPRVAADFLFPK